MDIYPEQMFQNNVVHHPLLQYQMLFPSLLMSLGATPKFEDLDEDAMIDLEGNVNAMDYLRFSALSNQLAITQINQVLMDIVMETPGDDIKKLTKVQRTFMELVKDGVSLLDQKMSETKTIASGNKQSIDKQESSLTLLTEMVGKGFLDNLSEMASLDKSIKQLANKSNSNARDFRENMLLVTESISKIQEKISNMTENPPCCNSSRNDPPIFLRGVTPPPETPKISSDVLMDIQQELRNLTKTLGGFVSYVEDTSGDRVLMKNLIETCSNASIGSSDVNLTNITAMIEEKLATSLGEIQPKVENVSLDLGKVDANLLKTQDDLGRIETSIENSSKQFLETLKQLTMEGFGDISDKIDNLYKTSVSVEEIAEPQTQCPTDFFAVGDECFFLNDELPMEQEDAKIACQNLKGYLAEPESLVKFIAFVLDMNYNNSIAFWMGGRKDTPPSTGRESELVQKKWYWDRRDTPVKHGWHIDYPQRDDDCLVLFNESLQTSLCTVDSERGFICQTSPTALPGGGSA